MLQVIHAQRSELWIGKRKITCIPVPMITVDRTAHGVEVDTYAKNAVLLMNDLTAVELAIALLKEVDGKTIAKGPWGEQSHPYKRLSELINKFKEKS